MSKPLALKAKEPNLPGEFGFEFCVDTAISRVAGIYGIYIYIYMVTRSAAPPLPPFHGLWSRMPPLLWDGVWVPSSLFPLWGGCGGFGVLGLA